MTKCFCLIFSLLIFSVSGLASASNKNFVDNELLVKTVSTSSDVHERLLKRANGASVEKVGRNGWQRIILKDGQSVESSIGELRKLPDVLAVQPNFIYSLQATPNDPQWTATGMYGLLRISAPQAWDITTGSPEVVVANIDTGMRLSHEDLASNIWTNPGEIPNNGIDDDGNGFIDDVHGWDFRYDDADPSDQHGHGTHTGGTIGAIGNNLLGVAGVNWNVRIMVIKIYSQAATDTTSAMLINAYDYVRLMKERGVNIKVTNNSYGGCNEACSYDQATKDAIDALGDADILNVFSAGNAGTNVENTPFFPGSYDSPSILNVAASNFSDGRASFSNFGITSVDVAAPGAGILSTTNGSNSSYGSLGGTSMAAPHVSGVAALIAAVEPAISAASLKATIMNTVDPLTAWNGVVRAGGRLNAFSAISNRTTCNFTPSQTTVTASTKGGYYSVEIGAAANCDYRAIANENWIVLDGPSTRSGGGKLSFRVRTNRTISRQGTIDIGDQKITISQSRVSNN